MSFETFKFHGKCDRCESEEEFDIVCEYDMLNDIICAHCGDILKEFKSETNLY